MAITLPAFLLRHKVTVRPYLGTWGQYGPPVEGIRVAKAEKLGTATTQAGVVRYATVTLVGRPDVFPLVPEGSRITLPDGREGYAQAVALHDGGGLPTPDHVEIGLTLPAPSYGAPLGGELVVVLHRVQLADPDRYGNTRYRTEEIPVQGAAVRILGSDERPEGGGTSTTDNLEVMLPPGTPVGSNDMLRVRGLPYEVDGTPEAERDPMTGGTGGIRVIARRVT
ncbi:hypothetical protein AB0B88_16235 [Micromonospora haikouensis]|uniref:hypothetical protein n=1 Tax=Actinomycetes TaxID=1760 RepID=UPI0034081A47